MPNLMVSKVIEAPIDDVWSVLRPFDEIGKILPPIESCELEGDKAPTEVGAIRRLEVDGKVIREQLVELSDIEYRCTYFYLEYPLPVEDRTSQVELYEVTDEDHTLVQWSSSFDIADEYKDEAVENAVAVYELGLEELAARLEG